MNRRTAAGCWLPTVAAAIALVCAPAARAETVVERIKADGVIRCGGVSRPGLVGQSADGHVATGLYLDLCRAIGAALLGPEGRIEFRPYDSDSAFQRVRDAKDDLSFLDGSEILDQGLAGRTTPGPPVVFASTAAMVPGDSPVKSLADLAGKTICFYQGSNAHRNLEAWLAAHALDFARLGLMEYVELYDTYNAGVCEAEVGESGDLAVARLEGAGAKLKSRILPEPLAIFPIFAVTPARDPRWAAIVAWAIYTLQRAGRRFAAASSSRRRGGADWLMTEVTGMAKISAGILLFRKRPEGVQVLLVHPGGPFWAKKDDGAWSIPKGLADDNEDLLAAARREFFEETGARISGDFIDLGSYMQPGGKTVAVWACEGDFDTASLKSNGFLIEWPPRSGKTAEFPEVDKAGLYNLHEALQKVTTGQRPIIAAMAARPGACPS